MDGTFFYAYKQVLEQPQFVNKRQITKSSKNLKKLIEQYKESELELLDFDSNKRDKAREAGFIIFEVTEHLKLLKEGKSEYTLEQVVEELTKANDLLNPIM